MTLDETMRRLAADRDVLMDDLSRYDEERWSAPVDLPGGRSRSMSELAAAA